MWMQKLCTVLMSLNNSIMLLIFDLTYIHIYIQLTPLPRTLLNCKLEYCNLEFNCSCFFAKYLFLVSQNEYKS